MSAFHLTLAILATSAAGMILGLLAYWPWDSE